MLNLFLLKLSSLFSNSQEQAIKEEAEKAARDTYEARLANCSEEEREALERAAAAAAEVAKSRKVGVPNVSVSISYMFKKHNLNCTVHALRAHATTFLVIIIIKEFEPNAS